MLKDLKDSFEQEFPASAAPKTSARDTEARVTGGCDYSHGPQPMNMTRLLNLTNIPEVDFNVERLMPCHVQAFESTALMC